MSLISDSEPTSGFTVVSTLPLTEKCRHYSRKEEVPLNIQKYWQQRYSIFQYYDSGIYMTDDAWFGVTPEPVALEIAYSPHLTDGDILIDMFAGAGGNAIAFALSGRWKHVVAIEKDASVLACAQRNARVYEVEQFITFVLGDSFHYLETLKNEVTWRKQLEMKMAKEPFKAHIEGSEKQDDRHRLRHFTLRPGASTIPVIFASPPWGGPGYSTDEIFDLSRMEPYNLEKLHSACRGFPHALYLPRTSDMEQIASLLEGEEYKNCSEKIEVVQYCLQGASKALVAYVPSITHFS